MSGLSAPFASGFRLWLRFRMLVSQVLRCAFQLSILSRQHSNNGLSLGGKPAIGSLVISNDVQEHVLEFAILEKTNHRP